MTGNIVYENIRRIGRKAGLHVDGGRTDQRAMVKCTRHSLTKNTKKNGMDTDFVAEQRGDRRKNSQDIYCRIDTDELREEYDKYIYDLPINCQKVKV
ncbi:hypothetical protein MmiEs2_04850 [Methanimicrococcus stummii]|uniref:Uncharacterized protein n=1 Tax=Methanimicrococcus stummii TaxID=3028294 RepID=A0AA96V9N8_9EURY|nr:hypothetical protein [Methanimicrococcus sp. Es2]WNY28300.1 hypothetical protein MmiEs2_04850 [Methanimicrococcus sp. Es2]